MAVSLRSGVVFTTLMLLYGCKASPSPQSTGATGVNAAGLDTTYDLSLPARWEGHYRIDSLSTAERGRALRGALVFHYLPSDTTIRPQALMAVAVYDSASWVAIRAEQGPPPGDSVAARRGRVYVIGLPQSNPFAPGSVDATVFQVLQLRSAELPGIIRFH